VSARWATCPRLRAAGRGARWRDLDAPPEYGWQVQVRTFELVGSPRPTGVVAFLVAYTTHLGPVRALMRSSVLATVCSK